MAKFPPAGQVLNEVMAFTAIPWQLSFGDPTGTGTTYSIPVPAGCFVVDVFSVVTQVCDGSPTLTIGDGDDVDGYLTSANIAPGTALTVTTPAVKKASAIANPYQYGKYYPTADTVDFIWTAGTTPTTGQIKGFMIIGSVKSGGILASLTA